MLNIFNKLSSKLSLIFAKYKKTSAPSDPEKKQTFRNTIILAIASIISIAFFTAGALQWRSHSQALSQNALDNSKAVLVNIVTDEIFNGKLYIQEEEKEVEPEKSVELTAISQEQENSPLKYRSTPCKDSESKRTNKIAIVITNLGLNKGNTLSALNMRKEFTLGFTPYAIDLEDWISQASAKGFEALINIPMQPLDYPVNDPGPLSLLLNLSNNENLSRLSQIMLKSEKVVGFYSEQAEVFSQSKSSFTPIAAEIAKNKYMFLYGNTSNAAIMSEICKSVDLECQTNSLILDQDLDEDAIKKQLLALEGISYAKGFAVGFIRSYPLTINILKSWSDALNPDSISLVPISVTLNSSQPKPIESKEEAKPTEEVTKKELIKKETKTPKKTEEKVSIKEETTKPVTDKKPDPVPDEINAVEQEKKSDDSDAKSDNADQKQDDKPTVQKETPKPALKEKLIKDVKHQKPTPKKQQVKNTKSKKMTTSNTKVAAKLEQ